MEALHSAVLKGEQCLSWLHFQAAIQECEGSRQVAVQGEHGSEVKKGCDTVKSEPSASEDLSEVKLMECPPLNIDGSCKDCTEVESRACEPLNGAVSGGESAGVKVAIENEDLWKQFDQITNEMIITKAGRRMFPLLQVSLSGLQPDIPYAILLEFQLTVPHRWRFLNGEWQATSSSYTSESPEQRSVYIHPSSTLTGGEWMKDKVTFSKLKLSNKDDGKGKIKLHSLYRYQPRLHIVQLPSPLQAPAASGCIFSSHVFTETQFVAVTAYQNDQITQMKIKHNPYAKAFQGPQDTIHFPRATHEAILAGVHPSSNHTADTHRYHQSHPLATQATPTSFQHGVLCHPVYGWLPSPPYQYDSHHTAYHTPNGSGLQPRDYTLQEQYHQGSHGATPPQVVGQWAWPQRTGYPANETW